MQKNAPPFRSASDISIAASGVAAICERAARAKVYRGYYFFGRRTFDVNPWTGLEVEHFGEGHYAFGGVYAFFGFPVYGNFTVAVVSVFRSHNEWIWMFGSKYIVQLSCRYSSSDSSSPSGISSAPLISSS